MSLIISLFGQGQSGDTEPQGLRLHRHKLINREKEETPRDGKVAFKMIIALAQKIHAISE